MIICERPVDPDYQFVIGRYLSLVFVCRWSLFVVGLCLSSLFVVGCCLLLVVVCCWSLFFVGLCLSLVVVCCWSLFVLGRCLLLVVVCLWSLFAVGLCLFVGIMFSRTYQNELIAQFEVNHLGVNFFIHQIKFPPNLRSFIIKCAESLNIQINPKVTHSMSVLRRRRRRRC